MDIIQDERTMNEFKKTTFSKFDLNKVKKKLIQSIVSNDVNSSLHLSVELICSGHFIELWECIITVVTCYIHIGSPKLPIYIDTRFQKFRSIMNSLYSGENMLDARNNREIRSLFCEIISILSFSPKKHKYNIIKVGKEDFDLTILRHKLKSTHKMMADKILKEGDPNELYIPVNEILYALEKDVMNTTDACYWVEWMLQFELLSKKKKDPCKGIKREYSTVDEKYREDIIWIIWDIFFYEAKKQGMIYEKIIRSLLELYSIRYRPSYKRKRRFILYFAVSIFTEPVRFTIPIHKSQDTGLIEELIKNIHSIYKQIKKNEVKIVEKVSPKKEQRFNVKMNIISSMDYIPTL